MATLDTREYQRRQDEASAREYARARKEILILETALRLPVSSVPDNRVFSRLSNLQAQAARLIDPDDNGEQHDPIFWGDPKYFRQED